MPRDVHPRDQYKASPMKSNPFQGTSSYHDDYVPRKMPDHRGVGVPASPPKHVPFEGQSESHEVSRLSLPSLAVRRVYVSMAQVFKWIDIARPELSLGVETIGDVFYKLIPGHIPKPCRAHKFFTTVRDNETEITVKILAGDDPKASLNKLLGSFDLVGIRPAPRGEPKIDVVFDINPGYELWVGATDMSTGKSCDIRINGNVVRPTHELVRVSERTK